MKNSTDRIKQYYDIDSKEELRFNDKRKRIEFDNICNVLDRYICGGESVLDCAAGTGAYIEFLLKKKCIIVASDISERNVQYMLNEYSNNDRVKVFMRDARCLERFGDSSFDIVLCMGPLYHLKPSEWHNIISECTRVVKKDGLMVLSYMNRHFFFWNLIKNEKYKIAVADIFYMAQNGYFPEGKYKGFLGCCYLSTPKEIEEVVREFACRVVLHQAIDMELGHFYERVGKLDDQEFGYIKEYINKSAQNRNILGSSKSNLIILKKL